MSHLKALKFTHKRFHEILSNTFTTTICCEIFGFKNSNFKEDSPLCTGPVLQHTASYWNITILWTSHDDLTEK